MEKFAANIRLVQWNSTNRGLYSVTKKIRGSAAGILALTSDASRN